MKEAIKFIVKLGIIFALLYDINFVALPSFTTARIAFILILAYGILIKAKLERSIIKYLGVVFLILFVVVIQYRISGDPTQMSRILWFVTYGIVVPMFLMQTMRNREEFFWLVVIAVSIQALLAIFSFINPAFKATLYSMIIYTANFDEKQILRAVSFSSVGGASLSVVQSMGVLSALFILKYSKQSVTRRLFLWIQIVLIVVSTLITGRTGLVISMLAIFTYLLSSHFNIKSIAVTCLTVFLLLQVNYVGLIEKSMKDVEGFDVDFFTAWIENAFSVKDNGTREDLAGMEIPPLSLETIVGTGKVWDLAGGGNASKHDSGYVQAYYSMGLILAFFFYLSYCIFLIRQVKVSKMTSLYFLIIMLFIVEIKEPFIFQYALPFFILCTIMAFHKAPESFDLQILNKNIS